MKLMTGIALLLSTIASPALAQNDSVAAFERLTTLSGTWNVVESRAGGKSTATYRLTGRGSVLIEDLRAGAVGGMLTAYHLDQGTLVLTHFCGAGNQPRMRLKTVQDEGRRLRFEMYDITNLADPTSYHSTAVDVVFISDDRVDLAYEGTQGGRADTQTFRLTRQRPSVATAAESTAHAHAQITAAATSAGILSPRPAQGPTAKDDAQAFGRLKTLVGVWDVTERDNPHTREIATYAMTGAGSVLAEDLRAPLGEPGSVLGHMYTTYHMDKGRLVLSHFCGAGNQPRMRLRSVEDGGKRLSFELYDITNLRDATAYHSNAVEVVFITDDRVDLVYRGKAAEKTVVQVFQLKRRTTN